MEAGDGFTMVALNGVIGDQGARRMRIGTVQPSEGQSDPLRRKRRCRNAGFTCLPGHELFHQKEGRRHADGGSTSSLTMMPPQWGQGFGAAAKA